LKTGRLTWIPRLAIFLAGGAVTSIFFINLCATIYRCGCTWLWAGAADHCNIHIPGAKHCPWCDVGVTGHMSIYLIMIVAQALLSFWPGGMGWLLRLGLTLAAFPAVGIVLGLMVGWLKGYWS
jgi:hypothetical protein